MTKRSKGKADANQGEIDRTALLLGAGIIKCSDCPHLGFDRIYIYGGRVFFTEIKNPRIKDVIEALTPTEKKRRDDLNKHGGLYVIVQTPEDLMDSMSVTDEMFEKVNQALALGIDKIF